MPIKFCSEASFSGLRFFNEPEISDPHLKVPCALDFYVLKKINRPQTDLNPRTFDLEAGTLPRDHRGRLNVVHRNFSPLTPR